MNSKELEKLIEKASEELGKLEERDQNDIVRERTDELLSSLTELDNAEGFVRMYGDHIRFINEINAWAIWDGVRWREDVDGLIRRKFYDVIKEIEGKQAEIIKNLGDDVSDEERKEIFKSLNQIKTWVKNCKRKQVIDNSLNLTKTQENITVPYSMFDCKGQFLGVKNGVVDLRTGKLIQGDPRYMMMKASPIEYQPSAKADRWEQFLSEIMCGDEGRVDLLKQIAGSALVGNTKEKMFILNGKGANGKSTFVSIINELLGTAAQGGYGAVINPKAFAANYGNPEYFIATLKGARAIIMSETAHGMTLNDTLVKQIVDSEEGLQARVVRGEAFTFPVLGTVLMTTNAIPKVIATDNGIWRRLALVSFNRVFSHDEIDRTLIKQLRAELPGILAWAVEGAREYLKRGEQFALPEAVVEATAKWREDDDKVGSFLRECMTTDTGKVKLTDVLRAYSEWCRSRNYFPGGERELKKNLEARGCEFDNSGPGGVVQLRGWALLEQTDLARLRRMKEDRRGLLEGM